MNITLARHDRYGVKARTSGLGRSSPYPVTAEDTLEDGESPPASSLRPASGARFRGMVDAHFNFVWRCLVGLGVPVAHADDAAQQVFIVAAQKILSIEAGSERSFLVSTAHGVAANVRRAVGRRREVQADPNLEREADDTPDPEQNAESREAAAILDAFLASLSEELRSVFMLFELEGMTMASIAETLKIPPGTVASRLRRAREDFHEMARRVQADPPSSRGKGGRG
jgi:RNA polymerase sigma-70 factor, ECF subfamily